MLTSPLQILFALLAIVMLAFAGGLWGRIEDDGRHLPDSHPARPYRVHRHRRSMQLRVLVGLASLGMLVGSLVSPEVHRVVFLVSWLWVIFMLLWVVVLGSLMAFETRVYFWRELNRKHGDEQVIRRAIRRELGLDGNGSGQSGDGRSRSRDESESERATGHED